MLTLEINNNFVQWSGDLDVLNVLYEELSFKHPQAFHMQKRLKYSWDGMVRPLSKKGRMDTGLLQKAVDIVTEIEEDFMVKDYRDKPKLNPIPKQLGPFIPRSYQTKSVEAIISNYVLEQWHPRGVIAFSVGAGKTLIMLMLHATISGGTIIVTDRKVMFEQLVADAIQVFGTDEVGWIKSKNVRFKPLMVCMIQSLKNGLKTYEEELENYNTILVDEADAAMGATTITVLKGLPQATVRIGFSGSIFIDEKEKKKDLLTNTRLREMYGDPLMRVTAKELEDEGYTTKAVVKLIKGNRGEVDGIDIRQEFERIFQTKKRAKAIAKRIMYNWAHRGVRKMFIFTKYIDQTEELYDNLASLLPEYIKMDYSHHKKVGDVLERFRDGDLNVLVTSLYLKRGINVPNLELIINNSGGLEISNPIQIFGRGVRLMEGKDKFVLEDFMERDSRYFTKHSKERIKLYKTLGLEIRNYSHIS